MNETAKPDFKRVEIDLDENPELHAVGVLGTAALAKRGGIFVLGGVLARVIQMNGRAKAEPLSESSLKGELSWAACFMRYDGRSRRKKEVYPPHDVVAYILSSGRWPFPNLRGIASHPTVTPSGRSVAEAGFEPETGYYLDFNMEAA